MIRSIFAAAVARPRTRRSAVTTSAEDKKEVKLTGTLVCGKCSLKADEVAAMPSSEGRRQDRELLPRR